MNHQNLIARARSLVGKADGDLDYGITFVAWTEEKNVAKSGATVGCDEETNNFVKASRQLVLDLIDALEVGRPATEPGCLLAGPGRGDCEHAVGLPGKSIPGQHDGDDDTVDHYGKPNGWCWFCWNRHIITTLEALVEKRGDDLVAQEWR